MGKRKSSRLSQEDGSASHNEECATKTIQRENFKKKSRSKKHKSLPDGPETWRSVDGESESTEISHQLHTATSVKLLETVLGSDSTQVKSLTEVSSVINCEKKLPMSQSAGTVLCGQPERSSHSPIPSSTSHHQQTSSPARSYSTYPHCGSCPSQKPEDLEEGEISGDTEGSQLDIVTEMAGLPRQWEWTQTGRYLGPRASQLGLVFTTMTYNVLSQVLLERHQNLYAASPQDCLDWNKRSQSLISEITSHSPDILCLQEVEDSHYKHLFKKELEAIGYQGHYLKRTNDKTDGCAIFFKKSKFALLQATPVAFNRGRLLDRDNVALILQLSPHAHLYRGRVPKICVATTHLLFNPRRGDIKLAQLMVLLAELDRCASVSVPGGGSGNASVHCPTILCGDFNLEPNSWLYNFLASGRMRYEGVYASILSGQREGLYSNVYRPVPRNFFPSHVEISDRCQYIRSSGEGKGPKQTATVAGDGGGAATAGPSSLVHGQAVPHSQSCPSLGSSNAAGPGCSQPGSQTFHHANSSVGFASGQPAVRPPSEHDATDSRHTGTVLHRFQFLSAYRFFVERLGVPEVTTQHSAAQCTVDYIFYTVFRRLTRTNRGRLEVGGVQEGPLQLLGRYGLMSKEEVAQLGNLPNHRLPSDHLCLCARFLLRH